MSTDDGGVGRVSPEKEKGVMVSVSVNHFLLIYLFYCTALSVHMMIKQALMDSSFMTSDTAVTASDVCL